MQSQEQLLPHDLEAFYPSGFSKGHEPQLLVIDDHF